MSTILGKAWDSLGSLFSPLGSNFGLKQMFERCLVARTKKEEEWLIVACLKDVKARLEGPSNTPSTIARCLAFVIFAETLGYKCEFAYIHAVKLAQYGSLSERKFGYLTCIFLLEKSDPLAVLAINTILRDLGSKNILLIGMALSASCYLIPPNQAPSVLPLLVEKLSHQSEFVRSKAVIALHHFLHSCPVHCCFYIDSVGSLLGDKDPGVVGFALQFLLDACKVDISLVRKYIPASINIQQQLVSGKLSTDYTYKDLSAPWMQITVLRLFQKLGEFPQEVITAVNETLQIAREKTESHIGEALVIECINCLILCKAENYTSELALAHVNYLLSSSNNNLRYAGLSLLDTVLHHFQFPLSSGLQKILLACMNDVDPSIKHKTLSLLCVAANKENVDIICSQVADYAHGSCGKNVHLRAEFVGEAVALTDKFPNASNYWHVAMLIRLLPLANQSQSKYIQKRIKCVLLSEANINEIRQKVLKILKKYSGSKTASTSVLEMFVWTLSHFGLSSSDSDSPVNIAQEIIVLGRKVLKHQPLQNNLAPEIISLFLAIINALMHLVEQHGIHLAVEDFLHEVKSAAVGNLCLRESCTELHHAVLLSKELSNQLKYIKIHEDEGKLDFTLSFLDEYVCESLRRNAEPYCPEVPKPFDLEGIVSDKDTRCLVFSKSFSVQPSSSDCTSPVSSEIESCFGSFSLEDTKVWPLKRKEVADVKLIWTKTGRVQDDIINTCNINEILEVPSTETAKTTETAETVTDSKPSLEMHLQSGEQIVCRASSESSDPLEALLHEDFQKLSFS